MTTGHKLALGAMIVASATALLAFAGASSTWQYYLTVDECLANAPQFVGSRLRVNGKIAANSLEIDKVKREAVFLLEGLNGNLKVICAGTLPDNLAEEMNVVAEGRLDGEKLMRAHRVLTKCASKYRSEQSS